MARIYHIPKKCSIALNVTVSAYYSEVNHCCTRPRLGNKKSSLYTTPTLLHETNTTRLYDVVNVINNCYGRHIKRFELTCAFDTIFKANISPDSLCLTR